ncbi:MAG: hypothetical protein RL621_1601, partial [Bacteroidota bacterium]
IEEPVSVLFFKLFIRIIEFDLYKSFVKWKHKTQ